MATTTDYAPASSLGWLDLDDAASQQVSELLRSFDEPGTLDALGLGSVRDAFSWILSPGTSTLHTRIRYFVFLPWIFAQLEAERVAAAEFSSRLRDREARLIDCLRHLGRNQGVIGYVAGRKLKYMPSSAYWGSLWDWGIRRLPLTIHEYGQRAAALGRHRPERDDDGGAAARAVSMWADLPPAPHDFLRADITFDLGPGEAQLLMDGIRRRHPGTLLAELCATPGVATGAAFPWDLLDRLNMPPQLVEALRHAQNFSELSLGPQLVYNLLLARDARDIFGRDTDELEEQTTEQLAEWAERIVGRHQEIGAWAGDMGEFWSFLALAEFRINHGTRGFVEAMVARAVADPKGFAEDPEVHRIIRNREVRLKSKRARLSYRAALENWHGDGFGGQFGFRWGITRRFLDELAAGLAAHG